MLVWLQASFFIAYVVTSGWTSASSELFRVIPFFWSLLKRAFVESKDDELEVPSVSYHKDIPRVLFFGLLGITYFFLAPLILPFLLVYFCLGYIIFRNQVSWLLFLRCSKSYVHFMTTSVVICIFRISQSQKSCTSLSCPEVCLTDRKFLCDNIESNTNVQKFFLQFINVYAPRYETAGKFWPIVHNSMIFSLVLMHAIAVGIFTLKKLSKASTLVFPLPILTLLFNEYCRKRFLPIFVAYSAEVSL